MRVNAGAGRTDLGEFAGRVNGVAPQGDFSHGVVVPRRLADRPPPRGGPRQPRRRLRRLISTTKAIEMPTAHHWYLASHSRIVTSWSSNVRAIHQISSNRPAIPTASRPASLSGGVRWHAAQRGDDVRTGEERDDRPFGLGEAAVEPGDRLGGDAEVLGEPSERVVTVGPPDHVADDERRRRYGSWRSMTYVAMGTPDASVSAR